MADGGISDYMALKIGNSFLRNTAYSPVATVYLALYTVAPTKATAGTEVVAGGGTPYARQAATFAAYVSGTGLLNTNAPDFGVATVAYGTVVAVAIMDASTSGNMLLFKSLSTPIVVGIGGQVVFPIGSLAFDPAETA